jgi:hypothetical protein
MGQVTVGASLSWTITRNAHAAVFPLTSPAVQATTLVPLAKVLPEGGTHMTGTAPQLSLAVTLNAASVLQRPDSVFMTRSAGQEITGRSKSLTVTGNAHSWTLPDVSSAMQYTHVWPTGNIDPLGQSQNTATPGQLSVGSRSKSTAAAHIPTDVFVTI